MSDESKVLAESQSAEAVQATAIAAEATEKARSAQLQQAIVESEERTTRAMVGALRDVFGSHKKFDEIEKKSSGVNINVIANDIAYIKEDVREIKEKMEKDYVSMDMFIPVRNIVYGMVGVLGLATMGALLKLIFIP